MKNLEDTVREYYNEINSLTTTQEMGCEDDYLRLFNHTTIYLDKIIKLNKRKRFEKI